MLSTSREVIVHLFKEKAEKIDLPGFPREIISKRYILMKLPRLTCLNLRWHWSSGAVLKYTSFHPCWRILIKTDLMFSFYPATAAASNLSLLSSIVEAGCPWSKLGGLGIRPRVSNIWWSASLSLFGVVSNFSPVKMELAPAMKHSAFTKTHHE